MKIFILTDIEGAAGVVSFLDQTHSDAKYYEDAKKLLTAEVNAGIEGLLEAEAKEILILDGHGPGGIYFENLHPAAQLIHGRPLSTLWQEEVADCDAAVFIGQHAMAGTAKGNLNHTQNSRGIDYIKLNGTIIGEIAQFALLAGFYKVPVIALSGDDEACREIEKLIPGVTAISVKRGLSRTSAVSVSAPEAHKRIRNGMKQALIKHKKNPIKPVSRPGPYVIEKRYFTTDFVERFRGVERAEIIDSQTVRLKSNNIKDIIYA